MVAATVTRSTPVRRPFQGPVRPGTNVAFFRRTGRSVRKSPAQVARDKRLADTARKIAEQAARVERQKQALAEIRNQRLGLAQQRVRDTQQQRQLTQTQETQNILSAGTLQSRVPTGSPTRRGRFIEQQIFKRIDARVALISQRLKDVKNRFDKSMRQISKSRVGETISQTLKRQEAISRTRSNFQQATDKIKLKLKNEKQKRDALKLEIQRVEGGAEKQAREKGIKQLIKEGRLPEAIRLSTQLGAEKYFQAIGKGQSVVLGSRELTKSEITKGGRILGDQALFAGTIPFLKTRGGLLKNIPKNTKVEIIGTASKDGKRIITDIVLKTSNREIGRASGVSIVSKKKSISLAIGDISKQVKRPGIKFPSGKFKLIKKTRTFASVGVSKARRLRAILIDKVKQGVKIRKFTGQKSKTAGFSFRVRKGKIPQARIKFPSGKIANRIDADAFVASSKSFTVKDWTKITGNVLARKTDQIKFTAYIKNITKRISKRTASKEGTVIGKGSQVLTQRQKKLFDKALNNFVSNVASQVKVTKVKGLSKQALNLINSGKLLQKTTTKRVLTSTNQGAVVRSVQAVKPKLVLKSRARLSQRRKDIAAALTKQAARTKPKTKQRSKTKIKTKTKQETRQRQEQKQRQRINQREKLKEKLKEEEFKRIVDPPIIKGIVPLPFKLRKKVIFKKTKKKGRLAFNVFARPLKRKGAKKKPKLIKVNKVPLSKVRARDLRNYITDTSLSRTAKLKITKGKIKKPSLRIPRGYASKTKKKFRTFRVIKGKRKRLSSGRVIERGRFSLDTRGEKRGITVKRRISQLTRKISTKQLQALARGRAKLSRMRKRR